MRFRRKASEDEASETLDATETAAEPSEGPHDFDELPDDGVERVDLGSLLISPTSGKELRLQVDEKSGEVRSVVLAGEDGALELRAFAAPRHGELWDEVRPQIAADMTKRGGTASEREGRFGTELVCQLTVKRAEGGTGVQPSRVIGINGPRWLLRATLLGKAAIDVDNAADWEDALTTVVVKRGGEAMPVGEALPLTLPDQARRVSPDEL